MAPPKYSKEKFDDAVRFLEAIGIPRETISPVLKNLLKLYDYNWNLIADDNFRVLTDAIFDDPDPQEEQKRKANDRKNLDSESYNKKLKMKHQTQKPTPKMYGYDKRELVEPSLQQEAGKLCPQIDCVGKATRNKLHLSSSRSLVYEQHTKSNVLEDTPIDEDTSALPLDGQDLLTSETPQAVKCPQVQVSSHNTGYKGAHGNFGAHHAANQKYKGVPVGRERNMTDTCSNQEFSTNFEVARSNSGTGKLSFTYNSSPANHPDFRMPDMETVCKEMKARCLKTYKILEPKFSLIKLLDDICQCIVELGSESNGPREKGIARIAPTMDLSKPSGPQILQSNQVGSSCMATNNRMMLGSIRSSSAVAGGQNSSTNKQVFKHQLATGAKEPPHDVNDIAKGKEHVSIPIISGVGNGTLPPPFHYIPCNITFQNAYINPSLARIGDESCCSDCFGDCLAQPLPCACATETGGEFAYTGNGLLKEGFLDSCVSMLQDPHNHPHFHCKVCPNERVKVEANSDSPNTKVNPDPCKGHLIRKFIKECWSKCGCTRNCGNRVVQRGITRHLEVFLTPGKKGWGLRAAEELPPGAFICEYAGEILTNTELYERIIQKTGKARHTYPVLLDADWVTEGVLEDDHALCLDATFYGNVARFINHRCFDANIIGIPVEIETPDHHYYHLAFFTSRQTKPFEELTWDYGIDFDDVNHPVKAFKCCCGSELCRDKRSISRSKSRAPVLI